MFVVHEKRLDTIKSRTCTTANVGKVSHNPTESGHGSQSSRTNINTPIHFIRELIHTPR